eukprot:jgi/Botrbrau1/8054/Bobra.13_2s0023.1
MVSTDYMAWSLNSDEVNNSASCWVVEDMHTAPLHALPFGPGQIRLVANCRCSKLSS